MYLGDIEEDATVSFWWNTNDSNGASITRATDGTIKVRRDDGQDCTGGSVTDTEDTPDTGIHECAIDTNDNVNYTTGNDYVVWLDGAVIDGETVNVALATFSILNRSSPTPGTIADAVWDEVLTGATHNVPTSAGRRLRTVGIDASLIRENTCQAGSTASTIVLDAGASGTNNFYDHMWIFITDGTGIGQVRTLHNYVGGTQTADVAEDWLTTPANDSEFAIISLGSVHVHELTSTAEAQVQAECTDALNAYDPPTKGELDTAETNIIVEVDANETKIDALNDVSQAEVNAQCDTALTDYDGPTRAEATSDKDEIIVEVDANEVKIDALNDISVANVTTGCTTSLNTYDSPTRAEATTDKNEIIVQVNANETKIDLVQTDTTLILADTNELQTNLARLLGLALHNTGWRFVYNANNKQTTGKIYVYDSAANANTDDGATGVTDEYTVTMTLNANGDPTKMKVVKE